MNILKSILRAGFKPTFSLFEAVGLALLCMMYDRGAISFLGLALCAVVIIFISISMGYWLKKP